MMTSSVQNSSSLILASASPRRRELLAGLGVDFIVVPADIDETVRDKELPVAYVQRMAEEKARVGLIQAQLSHPGAHIALGSDTAVVVGDVILGKPADEADAARMLGLLAGTTHQVLSAVAVTDGERLETRVSATSVRFRSLAAAEMAAYWATGEPADKAGGYAIQGLGAVFVCDLQGSYSGVVGLPAFETAELLAKFGCRTGLDHS